MKTFWSARPAKTKRHAHTWKRRAAAGERLKGELHASKQAISAQQDESAQSHAVVAQLKSRSAELELEFTYTFGVCVSVRLRVGF